MQTKMTPIVSWSIWAGGLSLVMGIVTRNQLIAGFASDETGMSYVITALFAAGLVVSFLSARSLHKEWGILADITKTDRIPGSTGKTDLASVFNKLKGYKEKGEVVDIHTAIDTYHSKHNSRVRVVSIAAGLVISMGLLGTVVGLILSISGLGAMVENIGLSRTTMMDALKATVSGMGTAFYTTFFGALGGLILRAVAVSQLNSLSELCSEAAEYADKNLTAKLESKEEALNRQLSSVIESFGNMQREVDALTGRIAESIETTLGKFSESIAAVGDHAMEATKEAVSGMTGQFGEIGSTVKDSFGMFNEIIVKSGEEVHGAVSTVSEGIVKSGDELHESFGVLNDTLARAGEGVTGSFEVLNGTIAESGDKVSGSFEGLGSSVQQAGDTVAGSLADFK
uniref:MotA/TolQ/ExbB proton channel family protein n=1 Tax=Pontiella sp. TaxID=2837462 RepID=UPI0035649604